MQMPDEAKLDMLFKMCSHNENGTPDVPFVQSLIEERLEYLPEKKLYKFRSCEEKNLDALREKCIWMAPANQFADVFDSVIDVGLTEEAAKWIAGHTCQIGYALGKWFSDQTGCPMDLKPKEVEEFLNHCLDGEGILDLEKALAYAQETGDTAAIVSMSDALNRFAALRLDLEKNAARWSREIAEHMDVMRNSVRNSVVTYCMTERMDNHSLWENYADQYRGFCVEYDFTDFDTKPYEHYENLVSLFPMSYVEERPPYDILPLLQGGLQEFFDGNEGWKKDPKMNAALNLHLLYKKDDYRYEREWRFSRKGTVGRKCYFPFVSAIYAGKDISRDHLYKLLEIGRHLAVPVYRQEVDMFRSGFRYCEVKEVDRW